jgi:hypothetical protein
LPANYSYVGVFFDELYRKKKNRLTNQGSLFSFEIAYAEIKWMLLYISCFRLCIIDIIEAKKNSSELKHLRISLSIARIDK